MIKYIVNFNRVAISPKNISPLRVFGYTEKDLSRLRHFIQSMGEDALECISTNNPLLRPIDYECRNFIRSRFTLNGDSSTLLRRLLSTMPANYCALHIRTGALDIMNHPMRWNNESCPKELKKIEEYLISKILPVWDRAVFISSDSLETQNYFIQKYSLLSMNKRGTHSLNRSTEEEILSTLMSLCLISCSKHIYTYSAYRNISSFAACCSLLYEIPLEQIVTTQTTGTLELR